MIRPPLATAITAMLGIVVPASFVAPAFAGDTGYRTTTTSSTSVVERELLRRHELMERAVAALDVADRAMADHDYEKAFVQYKAACDDIPNSYNTAKLHDRAVHGLCDSGVAFAEQRIAEGRYGDAENICKTVVSEEYAPHCKRALAVLAHLEEPDWYNKTIGPKFRGNVEQVKQWFVEAKGFYDSGRYDLAHKRCDQILSVDPYNVAARKFQEQINRKRDDYAVEGYNEERSWAVWQVDNAWQRPVRKYDLNNTHTIETQPVNTGHSADIKRKLETIVLPKLEFRDATIREAIDYLKRKSVELDLPSHQGVNIVLKLESQGGGIEAAPAPAPAAPAAPVIPGLEPLPGAAAAPAGAPAVSNTNPNDARITVSLTNIPLGEALRYVTSLAGLKYKVEDYAVSVVPLSVPTESLTTKEWKVPPGMFSGASTAGAGASPLDAAASSSGAPGAGDRTKNGGGSSIVNRVDAKSFFEAQGVQFPPGGSAVFLSSSSRLIVRNTQENLDLIDAVVQAFIQNGPVQVEIEAKFVEIQQDNLKELAFDWLLGQAPLPGSQRVFYGGGTTGTAQGVNPSNYPFAVGSGQNQTFPISTNLRSGSLAISQNAVDALLAGTSGVSAPSAATAALAGVFTNPQFQVVIHAINQKKGIDLLSAPRVTTKSGQRAVIEIIREFRYPTEFEPPQIPQTFGNGLGNSGGIIGGLNPLAQSNSGGSFPVTPTTPTAFETRNTGVTLEVEPVVGADGYTIDLNLVPQVVEFEGFVNYGSPIQTSSTNLLGQSVVNIITPNVINQPIFSTRKVTTSVTVFDGQTVVLGGLMREDVQKTEDKIPLLGDIPIIGRLFRSQTEQHLKRNLVIFVSARLINPAGDAVHSDEEQEEVVQTIPTPEATEPALPLMPK